MRSCGRKGVLFTIFVSAIASLLLAYYLSISLRYPYYFIWDMDQVVVMDATLIQSGLLPDHINHPGFGLSLVLVNSTRLAKLLHALSATTLSDLQDSLNPLWSVAEYASFARLHSPFVIMAIIASLWGALCWLLCLRIWQALLFLLVLGLQESMSYQAAVVRTEQYSILYWALAVAVTVIAARSERRSIRLSMLFFAGLFLGLSLFTKIQSLIFIGSFPFFMLLIFTLSRRHEPKIAEEPRAPTLHRRLFFPVLGVLNAVLFVLLLVRAHRIQIPAGMATFATHYGMTPTAYLFLAGFLLLALVPLLPLTPLRQASFISRASRVLTIMASGFLVSLLLHFLLYADPHVSLKYLLYDVKVVFLRQNPFAIRYSDILTQVSEMMHYNPVLFLAHIALLGLLFVGTATRALRLTKVQLGLCLVLTFLAFANLCVAVRFCLRDLIWAEISFNFLGLLYLGMLSIEVLKHRIFYMTLGTALMVAVLMVECMHLGVMPERIAANYNVYGWKKDQWLHPVYGYNHPKYAEILNAKYDDQTRNISLDLSPNFREVRDILRFVFVNQSVTLKNAGFVYAGCRVSTKHPDWRIASAPLELQLGTVVDNAAIPRNPGSLLKPGYVLEHSEFLDKLDHSVRMDAYAILPRPDLKVYIAFEEEDAPKLAALGISLSSLQIMMTGAEDMAGMSIGRISTYMEIPVESLTGRFFFIICRS